MNVKQMQEFRQMRQDIAELRIEMNRVLNQIEEIKANMPKKRGRPRKSGSITEHT